MGTPAAISDLATGLKNRTHEGTAAGRVSAVMADRLLIDSLSYR
jgi:hypothetical protein